MADTRAVARRIDHTLLKAEATEGQVDRVCDEAIDHLFAAVCVNGAHLARVLDRLRGTPIRAATVAGFPLGAGTVASKAMEASEAVHLGAEEVDIVAHLPPLLDADAARACAAIRPIVDAVREVRPDAVVKVIVETALLSGGVSEEAGEARIAAACDAVREAGADYIKTSSGFHPAGGATVEAVRLLCKHAGPLKVKAAGGIRTLAEAHAMIEAGADRLGCSASVAIVTGAAGSGEY